MFFLFLFLNLSVLVNVSGFFFSNFSFVDLVLGLKSIFGGLINIFPHDRDDFGQFGDFGWWILWLYFAINFFSEEEKCWEGSLWGSGLNIYKSTLSSFFLPIFIKGFVCKKLFIMRRENGLYIYFLFMKLNMIGYITTPSDSYSILLFCFLFSLIFHSFVSIF